MLKLKYFFIFKKYNYRQRHNLYIHKWLQVYININSVFILIISSFLSRLCTGKTHNLQKDINFLKLFAMVFFYYTKKKFCFC